MSFLRKRSHSQCSFTKGDDDFTVTRIDPQEIRPGSRCDTFPSSRSSSEVDASDFAVHDSCVLRNFPKHKSSSLRFLTWVAYTRKYTDEWITQDERRTCPLLWCRTIFPDQEAMLQHVWNCPHLSKGLYWCFHCQKPERVGKTQCKRCLGSPSRTDRMASVAKKIFSKLGTKSHRAEHFVPDSFTERSPSKDSKAAATSDFRDTTESFAHHSAIDWTHQYIQELPSTSVIPEMAGDWTAASHELPNTYVSEMQGTECPIELGVGSEGWGDNFYAATLEEWDVPALPVKGRGTSPKLARLDTSFTQMSAQSLHGGHERGFEEVRSSDWSDNPLSAIVSPLSPTGNNFDSNTLEVSPTDTVASGTSLFTTDSGYSSATTQSAWSVPATIFEQYKGHKESGEKKEPKGFRMLSEGWMGGADFSRPLNIPSVPVFPTTPVISDNIFGTMESVNDFIISEKPKLVSPHWSDAQSLVQSFSDVLDAHFQHSKASLIHLRASPTKLKLLTMSRASIVSTGLEVLAGILEGRKPTSIPQIFAFTHVAYAFAIAVNHDENKVHTENWFQASLSWANDLTSDQRQLYFDIAYSIWQPAEYLGEESLLGFSRIESENSLVVASKYFLDVFESFAAPESIHRPFTDQRYNFPKEVFERNARIRVIDELKKSSWNERIMGDIFNVERRLIAGQISNSRHLELELICAGKLASQSDITYTRFLHHLAILCNSLYQDETDSSMTRVSHHIRDISHIQRYLTEELNHDDSEKDECHEGVGKVDDENPDNWLINLNFDARTEEFEACVAAFANEADEILNHDHSFADSNSCDQTAPTTSFTFTHHSFTSLAHHSTPNSSFSAPASAPASPPKQESQQIGKTYRCHCGYEPSGEERWKASNLRRHKRTQHPVHVKVHRCRYPGCMSTFTRSDNLRSHQRDKGHVLGVGIETTSSEVKKHSDGGQQSGSSESAKKVKRRRIGGESGLSEWPL